MTSTSWRRKIIWTDEEQLVIEKMNFSVQARTSNGSITVFAFYTKIAFQCTPHTQIRVSTKRLWLWENGGRKHVAWHKQLSRLKPPPWYHVLSWHHALPWHYPLPWHHALPWHLTVPWHFPPSHGTFHLAMACHKPLSWHHAMGLTQKVKWIFGFIFKLISP